MYIRKTGLCVMTVLLLFVLITIGFAQQDTNVAARTTTVSTWVLDDFDNHELSTGVNEYNGGRHDIEWDVVGSQYITYTDAKPYPQKALVQGFPVILPQEYMREKEAMQVFAVRGAFNTKGINTLELYPIDKNNTRIFDKDGNPERGIFFFNAIYQLGLYALGIMRDYTVSAVFSSDEGRMFEVVLGNLKYRGWKVLVADIPISDYISEEFYINHRYVLKLEKIVIRTNPAESVSDFVVYFDQMFYTLASVNNRYYDGYELSRPEFKYNYEIKDGKNNVDWTSGSSEGE